MAHHKGTSTFILQRATAVLLIPLVGWFLYSVIAHAGSDYQATRAWASNPVNAIALGVFITIGAVHMRIGLQEIIDDYLSTGFKNILSLLNWLVALCVIGGALWSLYTLIF